MEMPSRSTPDDFGARLPGTEHAATSSERTRYLQFVREAEAARVSQSAAQLHATQAELNLVRSELARVRAEHAHLVAKLGNLEGSRVFRAADAVRLALVRIRQKDQPESPTLATASVTNESGDDRPTVSVIMPVYNKGDTLIESIASVRAQTLPTWELIVWDDGSTDPLTNEILDRLAEPGIVVVRAVNQGVVAARNAAIDRSRGEFVCCLDPDDVIDPTYLEKAVLYLESHAEVAVVFPYQRTIGGPDTRWEVPNLHPKIISQQNSVPVCAVVRREALEAVNGFNAEMHDGCEDWELWAHLAELGFVGKVLPEYLFGYRFSQLTGRDAVARPFFDEHRKRIMRLHPRLGDSERPLRTGGWEANGAARLASQPWSMPTGTHRPVVFFVPWMTAEGGAEAFLRTLAQGLVDQGRTVVFIATLPRPATSEDGLPLMQAVTPYVYSLPSFLPDELWLAFVRSIVWRLHVPIVVNVGSSWLYHHLVEVRQSTRGPAKVIDVLFNHVGHLPANIEHGTLIDHTVVVHSVLQELLVEHFHVPGRVSTIPVGIQPGTPREATTSPASHRLPIVGWLGRMSPEKNPEWFVELARSLAGLALFRMAGTGSMLDSIRDTADEVHGLEVEGYVPDAAEFLAGCDLLVNTSSIEGISVVAMEAIALGVPVLATTVGGMSDLIEPGINGDLTAAESWREMVEPLRRMLREDGLAQLTKSVRSTGLDPAFHKDAMIKSYLQVLT